MANAKCYLCGDSFYTKNKAAAYCSIACKSVAEGSWFDFPSKAKVRLAIFARDQFRCVYCGINTRASRLHIDHILPVSREGQLEAKNIVTACNKCNSVKGDILFRPEIIKELWKSAFALSTEEIKAALKLLSES